MAIYPAQVSEVDSLVSRGINRHTPMNTAVITRTVTMPPAENPEVMRDRTARAKKMIETTLV